MDGSSHTSSLSRPGSLTAVALYAAAGLAAGALDKWADEAWRTLGHGGLFLGGLGTSAGLWAFALALIAWLDRGAPRRAALDATVFFLGLCAGYYAYSQVVFGYSGARVVAFWLLAAVTVVPAASAALAWSARERTATGTRWKEALVVGVAAAVPLGQALSYGFALHARNDAVVAQNAVSVAQVALAAGIVLLLVRQARARLLCLLVALPAAGLWAVVLDHQATLMSLVGRL